MTWNKAPRTGNVDLLPERIGAGFIIDSSGLAVTAAHVVTGCDRVVVKLAGGRVVLAEKIGEDEDADIALLRLPMSLPAQPTFGNAAALRAGDWVLAAGEPTDSIGRSRPASSAARTVTFLTTANCCSSRATSR